MNIKTMLLSIALIFAIIFTGCGDSGGGGGGVGNALSGTITGGTYPKVGLFPGTVEAHATFYQFDDSAAGDPDEVLIEWNSEPEPYVPVVLGTVDAGTYSIEMPAQVSNARYYLIAWDDTDQDGLFNMSTEYGYFALKLFPKGTYTPNNITFDLWGMGEWVIWYYDGFTNYYVDFSTVGVTGYNFTID